MLEEENERLASKLAQLLKENKELENKLKLDPEREAERKELEVAILKNKLEKEQKAISRLTAEVSKETLRNSDLIMAQEQGIDNFCSHLQFLPFSGRKMTDHGDSARSQSEEKTDCV